MCHGKHIYVVTCCAVYKCVEKSNCTLSAVQVFVYSYRLPPFIAIGNGYLYLYKYEARNKAVSIIDSDTMTLLSTILLQHNAWDIAVSCDSRLHVATYMCDNGVHIYTTDGTYTGIWMEGGVSQYCVLVMDILQLLRTD